MSILYRLMARRTKKELRRLSRSEARLKMVYMLFAVYGIKAPPDQGPVLGFHKMLLDIVILAMQDFPGVKVDAAAVFARMRVNGVGLDSLVMTPGEDILIWAKEIIQKRIDYPESADIKI